MEGELVACSEGQKQGDKVRANHRSFCERLTNYTFSGASDYGMLAWRSFH